MYGSINPHIIEDVIQRGLVCKDDCFLDVGSGIGQVSFALFLCQFHSLLLTVYLSLIGLYSSVRHDWMSYCWL